MVDDFSVGLSESRFTHTFFYGSFFSSRFFIIFIFLIHYVGFGVHEFHKRVNYDMTHAHAHAHTKLLPTATLNISLCHFLIVYLSK